MKRVSILMVLAIMMFGSLAYAQENRFVEELKKWDYSLGGMAYLKGADTFYYSCGAKRDLGDFFNWLKPERLYGELGYLNTHMVNNTADIGEKAFAYAGLSTNANFIVQSWIEGLNKLLDSNFYTPEILNKVMATIGVLGAKRFDSTFWNLDEGYDWGVNVSVIKLEW